MKNPLIASISILCLSSFLAACGGGSDGGSEAAPSGIDNSKNNWRTSGSIGYAGGDVVFGTQKIVGEWSTARTAVVGGTKDESFSSTPNYAVLGIKFDSIRYYEYWADFKFAGGKVTSNGAWTPEGGYGVSQDGKTLTVELNPKKSFVFKNAEGNCMTVTETETRDEYRLCRVAG